MILLRTFAAATLLALGMTPASATATLTCDIKDANLEFSLQGSVGSFSTVASLQGRIDVKKRKPAFGFDLTMESLLQQWIDGPDLRLRIRNSFDDEIEAELVVVTTRASATDYRGRYSLNISQNGKTQKSAGRVTCVLG